MEKNNLPKGWALAKLSDLGEVNRGRSRHRPRYAAHLYGGQYPFIQTGDIKNSCGRITEYQQTYSEEGLAQSRLWPSGTMCITIAANIAETGILTFSACFPDSVVGFIPDNSKCDVRFVEYVFRYLRHQIQHEASGSVQDNINLETLDRLRFPLPPLDEQRAIAHILGTLDDKIELNRRINETLEAMARALFKSWFVDFDPVRLKAEGRWKRGQSLPGLPAHLFDLFPDSFVDSELGEIPKGWRLSLLEDEVETFLGGTPSRNEPKYWGGDIPWINSGKANEFRIIEPSEYITKEGLESSATKLMPARTPMIAITGATLGQVSISEIETCANQSIVGVLGSESLPSEFIYFWIKENIDRLISSQTGGAQQHINKNNVNELSIICPSSQIIAAYLAFEQPLFERIKRNCFESRNLAAIRKLLLPKLMNGKITTRKLSQ